MATTITKTVKSAGGDYTTLSAYEAGEQGDLPALDEIHQAECYAMQDTTAVTFDGWTTDATRYIRIFAASGAVAQVPFTTMGTYYREAVSATHNIIISENYLRIERISFKTTISTVNSHAVWLSGGGATTDIRILSCLFVGPNTSTANNIRAIRVDPASINRVIVANCAFYDWFGSTDATVPIDCGNTTPHVYVYNCTVYNCKGVFSVSAANAANIRVKNTGFDSNGIGSAEYSLGTAVAGSFHADSTDNASDLADAPGSNPENSVSPSFSNEGTRDLRLNSGDTAWLDKGADLSGDAVYAVSSDFNNGARSGLWDIGALAATPWTPFDLAHTSQHQSLISM